MSKDFRMTSSELFIHTKDGDFISRYKTTVKGKTIEAGVRIGENDRVGGMDFYLMRYLDLAVREIEEDHYEVVGFLAPKDGSREIGV